MLKLLYRLGSTKLIQNKKYLSQARRPKNSNLRPSHNRTLRQGPMVRPYHYCTMKAYRARLKRHRCMMDFTCSEERNKTTKPTTEDLEEL